MAPVINTSPIVSTVKEVIIKPSKTTSKEQNNKGTKNDVSVKSQVAKTIVQSSKVEIKPVIGTKVNVVEAVNSVVNVAPAPSSKVQVVPVQESKKATKNIITKVEVVANAVTKVQQPVISSHVEVRQEQKPVSVVTSPPTIVKNIVEIHADEEPAVIVGNNIGEPEYDFLSRQPSEVIEETYKVVNLKPSSKFRLKPRPTQSKRPNSLHHPTGLVTKLGGTVVKDGTTTVHETSVIGTYISGKYAQVLQSTSQVYGSNNNKHHHHGQKQAKINPSGTLRILKTAAPSLGKASKHNRHLEPTPAGSINDETALPVEALFNSQNSIKQGGNRKQSGNSSGGGSFKRFKNRQREQEIEDNEAQEHESHANSNKRNSKHRSAQQQSSRKYVLNAASGVFESGMRRLNWNLERNSLVMPGAYSL